MDKQGLWSFNFFTEECAAKIFNNVQLFKQQLCDLALKWRRRFLKQKPEIKAVFNKHAFAWASFTCYGEKWMKAQSDGRLLTCCVHGFTYISKQ